MFCSAYGQLDCLGEDFVCMTVSRAQEVDELDERITQYQNDLDYIRGVQEQQRHTSNNICVTYTHADPGGGDGSPPRTETVDVLGICEQAPNSSGLITFTLSVCSAAGQNLLHEQSAEVVASGLKVAKKRHRLVGPALATTTAAPRASRRTRSHVPPFVESAVDGVSGMTDAEFDFTPYADSDMPPREDIEPIVDGLFKYTTLLDPSSGSRRIQIVASDNGDVIVAMLDASHEATRLERRVVLVRLTQSVAGGQAAIPLDPIFCTECRSSEPRHCLHTAAVVSLWGHLSEELGSRNTHVGTSVVPLWAVARQGAGALLVLDEDWDAVDIPYTAVVWSRHDFLHCDMCTNNEKFHRQQMEEAGTSICSHVEAVQTWLNSSDGADFKAKCMAGLQRSSDGQGAGAPQRPACRAVVETLSYTSQQLLRMRVADPLLGLPMTLDNEAKRLEDLISRFREHAKKHLAAWHDVAVADDFWMSEYDEQLKRSSVYFEAPQPKTGARACPCAANPEVATRSIKLWTTQGTCNLNVGVWCCPVCKLDSFSGVEFGWHMNSRNCAASFQLMELITHQWMAPGTFVNIRDGLHSQWRINAMFKSGRTCSDPPAASTIQQLVMSRIRRHVGNVALPESPLGTVDAAAASGDTGTRDAASRAATRAAAEIGDAVAVADNYLALPCSRCPSVVTDDGVKHSAPTAVIGDGSLAAPQGGQSTVDPVVHFEPDHLRESTQGAVRTSVKKRGRWLLVDLDAKELGALRQAFTDARVRKKHSGRSTVDAPLRKLRMQLSGDTRERLPKSVEQLLDSYISLLDRYSHGHRIERKRYQAIRQMLLDCLSETSVSQIIPFRHAVDFGRDAYDDGCGIKEETWKNVKVLQAWWDSIYGGTKTVQATFAPIETLLDRFAAHHSLDEREEATLRDISGPIAELLRYNSGSAASDVSVQIARDILSACRQLLDTLAIDLVTTVDGKRVPLFQRKVPCHDKRSYGTADEAFKAAWAQRAEPAVPVPEEEAWLDRVQNGEIFFANTMGTRVRAFPDKWDLEESAAEVPRCSKIFVKAKRAGCGVMVFCCPHGQCIGVHVLSAAERKLDMVGAIFENFLVPPIEVCYDHACNLADTVLNRAVALSYYFFTRYGEKQGLLVCCRSVA